MRIAAAPKNSKPNLKQRAPGGVLTRSPVALRLFPDELAQLKDGARKDQRTDAAFARLCFLYGLSAYERGVSLTV